MQGGPGKEKPVGDVALAFRRFFTAVFALRCPNCGAGRIAKGPFNIVDVCGVCHAKFTRGDAGNWLVAATLNYFFTAVLCILTTVLLVRAYGFFSGLAFVVAGFALVYGALLYRPMKTLAVWTLWLFGFIYPD